jgi:hypothetical protein
MVYNSVTNHLNSANLILFPYLQNDATHVSCQELGDYKMDKWYILLYAGYKCRTVEQKYKLVSDAQCLKIRRGEKKSDMAESDFFTEVRMNSAEFCVNSARFFEKTASTKSAEFLNPVDAYSVHFIITNKLISDCHV